MGYSFPANLFRSGDKIDPDSFNRAEESAIVDMRLEADRRFAHAVCVVPFHGLADTDDASIRTIRLDLDYEWRIEHVDLYCCDSGGSSATYTLTIDDSAGTAIDTYTISATATSGVAHNGENTDIRIPSDTTVDLVISASATVAMTNTYAVLNIVVDKMQGSSVPSAFSPLNLKAGDTPTASQVNTQNTNLGTDATNLIEGKYITPAFSVIARDNVPASSDWHQFYIPSDYKGFSTIKHYMVADNTYTVTATVKNAAGSSQASDVLTGAGATTIAAGDITTDASVVQTAAAPETSASDWYVTLVPGGSGSLYRYWIVLGYT